jgi:DNA-binding response OmpR family regulator
MKILICDDDIVIARLIKIALSDEIDITTSPSEAIEKAKTGNYDAAIIDLLMPERSGYDVVREIRKFNQEMRIVLITASDIEFARQFAPLTGAETEPVEKTGDLAELRRRLFKALGRS